MRPPKADATLDVTLRVGDRPIKLAQLRELSVQLQRTLAAVAGHLADDQASGIDFEIVEAGIGSLSLGLRAVAEEGAPVLPEQVFATFTEDIANIRHQSYRPSLTSGLAKQYRALVTCLDGEGAVVEYAHGKYPHVVIDDGFRRGFDIALKERIAEDTSVVGYLDAVNAHKSPYTFYLYPKLEDVERVVCRFPAEMVGTVAGLLKQTVKVQGTGHFAPVGIYPLRIDVRDEPARLTWNPGMLRSFVGNLSLVPEGMSAAEYLQRNREAAGLGD